MRPYQKLRKELYGEDITQQDICKVLDRSKTYVSDRMCGKADWNIGEAYILLRMLGREPEEIFEFFPPDGGIKKGVRA